MKRLIQPALALVTMAFGIAPALTPPFTGYDPTMFPVVIQRPAIQPAGYAFAIWGLIYLWLIMHAGFGLVSRRGDPRFQRPAWPLSGSILLGTIWLAIAERYPLLATAVILIMAALALNAYLMAEQTKDRMTLAAPLAIYAGWLTAASAVSTGVVLAGYGVLSNPAMAYVMLALVLAIALSVQRARPNLPVYGLTVAWASVGIAVANAADMRPLAFAALAGAAVMAGVSLWPAVSKAISRR